MSSSTKLRISFLCLLFLAIVTIVHCDIDSGIDNHVHSNPSYSGLSADEIQTIVAELKAKIKGQVKRQAATFLRRPYVKNKIVLQSRKKKKNYWNDLAF